MQTLIYSILCWALVKEANVVGVQGGLLNLAFLCLILSIVGRNSITYLDLFVFSRG